MAGRQQIQEIPDALRRSLEKARAEYGELVRRLRFGDGPVFVCAAADCLGLEVAAQFAFESFLGLPVVARPAEVFLNYGHAILRPRSVLIMLSAAGEWPDGLELSTAAHERGCTLAAFTSAPEGPIAKSADHVFPVQCGGDADSRAITVCMHAILHFLAFESMRALKKPKPWWDAIAQDFEQLPGKLEWVFTQLSSVIKPLAAELAGASGLGIAGGGFCQYPAWRSALRMKSLTDAPVEAVDLSDSLRVIRENASHPHTLLFLSGSQSKLKKLVHRRATEARSAGARVLSITDANDRALAENSDVSILVPELQEAPSSTLALFLLDWLAVEFARASNTQKQASANH